MVRQVMHDDLYRLLGVGKTAKPETIERAYRRMAMKHHPDRGGDRAKFEQVACAYEVLRDPARRSRYDETGDASTGPDNTAIQVVEELASCLGHVLNGLRQAGKDPTKHDLIDLMRKVMGERHGTLILEQKRHEREIGNDEALLGRFTAEGAENFLESFIQQQLNNRHKNLTNVTAAVERLVAAQAFLKHCKFRMDAEPPTNSQTISGGSVLAELWRQAMLNGTTQTATFEVS